MNTDEVSAMIGTVTEGRIYAYELDDAGSSITCGPESVALWPPDGTIVHDVGRITDPRTAREIAALLVAWADAKEAAS